MKVITDKKSLSSCSKSQKNIFILVFEVNHLTGLSVPWLKRLIKVICKWHIVASYVIQLWWVLTLFTLYLFIVNKSMISNLLSDNNIINSLSVLGLVCHFSPLIDNLWRNGNQCKAPKRFETWKNSVKCSVATFILFSKPNFIFFFPKLQFILSHSH